MKTFVITNYQFATDFEFFILEKTENLEDILTKHGLNKENPVGVQKGYTVLTEEGIKCYLYITSTLQYVVHELIHCADIMLHIKGCYGTDFLANSEIRAYTVEWLMYELHKKTKLMRTKYDN
jgi:hypothetical protein